MTLEYSSHFEKYSYQISSVQFELSGQTEGQWKDRRTDGHDETNSCFCKFV